MLPAILAPVAGILIQKGLGGLVDILGSLGDAGVQKAKDLIFEKTGIDITSTSQVETLNSDQIYSLKETILNNFVELQKIHNLNRGQDLENTKDARAMNIELAKLGMAKQWTFPNIIAACLLMGSAWYIYRITFTVVPPDNIRFADTILGFLLGTVVATLLNFLYGSSMKDSRWAEQEQWDATVKRAFEVEDKKNNYYSDRRKSSPSTVSFPISHEELAKQIVNHSISTRTKGIAEQPVTETKTKTEEVIPEEYPDNQFTPTENFKLPEIDEYTEEEKLSGKLK